MECASLFADECGTHSRQPPGRTALHFEKVIINLKISRQTKVITLPAQVFLPYFKKMAETSKTNDKTPKTETKQTAKTEAATPKVEANPPTAPKAETTKTTATAKVETKPQTAPKKPAVKPKVTVPKVDAKKASAPKVAAKATPKAAPKAAPKSAPKAETKTDSAPKAQTDSKANAAQMPNDFAKMIVNQLIEAQRMWLEMTTQQTALIFKTVSDVMGMSENAPTEELAKMAKNGVTSFIEAQKYWAETAMQQSAQLMQTVQSNVGFGGGMDALGTAQQTAGKGVDILVNMRTAWLDFAEQQNKQIVKALKSNLNLDDSSPVSAIADFAQQTMSSYVEIQKRWLDMASQIPFLGGTSKDKK